MSSRRFALLAALAFFAMFVAGNLIANSWFRGWRLDLTANHLYSLSPGTRQVISAEELSEPIELTLFYSRDAGARYPELQAYAARVREMLQTYEATARGRIRFVEIDPKPFSEEEDRAVEAGVQPVTVQQGADPIYFGLSGANAIDDRRSIPFFDNAREPFLEYEITRVIYELQNPDPSKVALITSLPLDPAAAANPQFPGMERQSAFAQELGRFMSVEKLAPDFTEIPADARVLAIIHPGPMTPAQMYAIDQFIMRTGRAFIALDPASMTSAQMAGDPMTAMMGGAHTSSNLAPLFTAWGLSMTPEVVADGGAALPVQTQNPAGQTVQAPQPLFFRVDGDRLAQGDLMTAPLQRGLNFGMAGGLTWSEREGLTVTPLARTTGETMRMPPEQALMRPSPFDLMQSWSPSARVETVALRLSGPLTTAFPNGPPEGAAPLPAGQQTLTRTTQNAEIVVVADSDFLADDFYVDPQRGASFADNGAFALNAIDILGGSQALVSLRARAPSLRRMELVENLANDAQRRIEQRQQQLQTELQQTETRLQELRARGQGSGYFAGDLGAELSPEERTEIDRFTTRVTEVRRELRSVGRDLRADIDTLKALVVFVNMWLAPLAVAGAGLFLFWRRQRRARRSQP